jgi:hypothetical protein
MTDVTRILSAIEQGDPHAAGQLLPLVYDELRRAAQSAPTALSLHGCGRLAAVSGYDCLHVSAGRGHA